MRSFFFLGAGVAAACLFPASSAFAQHEAHASPVIQDAGTIADPFRRGLYLLHNFEYESAAAAFRAAQRADPANVMAFWGEAMTYNHPLWAFQDAEGARAVLARLGPDAAVRRAKARNPREAQWLDAVEMLYGEGSKVERDRAYHDRMRVLFDADRSDIDARSFYALATLGLAHTGRDTALYMKSAALLEEAFPAHSDHPGLLHYMIHSYDDPDHAPLGERAAARYARIAGDAGHAQHMVSHIYLALGRWEEVERSNITADSVVDGQRKSAGMPPSNCGHYNDWLIYSLDQQGKDSGPRIEACRIEAFATLASGRDRTTLGGARNMFNSWATIAVRHGVDTGSWPEWATVPAGEGSVLGRFDLAYARLLAARDDRVAVSAALADLKRLKEKIAAAMPAERPDDHESAAWLDRAVAQGEAIVELAEGRKDEGLRLLRAAAEAEAALPDVFGPPIMAKPSFELLGDELLAAGDKDAAAEAYRRALMGAPGRKLSLAGLAAASR